MNHATSSAASATNSDKVAARIVLMRRDLRPPISSSLIGADHTRTQAAAR